jgi:hypothetical protein
MSSWAGMLPDGTICRDEPRGLSWRFESLHPPLPLASGWVRILRAVIQVPVLAVFHARQDLPLAELVAPLPNRFVSHRDAASEEMPFHVARTVAREAWPQRDLRCPWAPLLHMGDGEPQAQEPVDTGREGPVWLDHPVGQPLGRARPFVSGAVEGPPLPTRGIEAPGRRDGSRAHPVLHRADQAPLGDERPVHGRQQLVEVCSRVQGQRTRDDVEGLQGRLEVFPISPAVGDRRVRSGGVGPRQHGLGHIKAPDVRRALLAHPMAEPAEAVSVLLSFIPPWA